HLKHCHLVPEVVPSDATVVNQLRSPALFGYGLIDSIPETTILANAISQGMGIQGVANMVPDQNGALHAGRFGQKAAFPSLLFFTASAMFNEFGITNPYFLTKHLPQGQPIPPPCITDSSTPNDDGTETVQIYQFEAFLAPAPTKAPTQQITAGK